MMVPVIYVSRKPKRPTLDERFVEIYQLRLDGLSYRKIGHRLKISGQRVQQIMRPNPTVYNAIKRRAKGQCEQCRIHVKDGHLHHKEIRKEFGEFNGKSNLQYLCPSCHRKKHAGGFVIEGIAKMESSELKDIRLHLGLTQVRLGKRLGVTWRTIARWEAGAKVPETARLAIKEIQREESLD